MPELRVAFFLSHLAGGGAERVAINLAAEYLKQGMAVDFVLVRAEGVLMDAVPHGSRIIGLDTSRALYSIFKLAHYLKKNKPDAVFSAPSNTHIIILLAKLLAGSRTKTMLHIGNHVSTLQKTSSKIQEKIYPLLLWLLQPLANAIIAVSDGVAQDLAQTARILPQKISTVYNPIYRPEMDAAMREPLYHPWFAEGQPPVILAAGRLVEQKDYPTLLRAFARVRNQRPARLVILGEGKLLSELKQLAETLKIARDVDFAGFDPNPYRYMAHCSVFILSSAWEGFANVIAEALSCGAQVASTHCESGPSEILNHGEFGRLAPVGDDATLASAIIELLDYPLPKESLQQRGRSFTASAAAAKYLEAAGIKLP